MKNTPYCSIIVLNYFGERVIENVINSLLKLDYPKNKFEIIVVDNGSKDKSVKVLRKFTPKFKNFKLILSAKNLGFSKGNNLGLKQAKGKYVVLLNNDCVVDKKWLIELVKTAEKDDKIFAVNSKIKLYPRYIKLILKSASPLLIGECKLMHSNLCKLAQQIALGIKVEYKNKLYYLEVPYDPINDHDISIILNLGNTFNRKRVLNLVGIPRENYRIIRRRIKQVEHIYTIRLSLTDKIINQLSYDLIQNAGIIVFQNGAGRDIGSIVRYNQQTFEGDLGQYDKEKEIYAACAAASLYRKGILEKLGYLDSSYFMYYEDVDISERARMIGYKVVYQPKAEVRHIHALSSKEWSPFFVYQAEKGRMLHLIHNFPIAVFIREYIIFIVKIIESSFWIMISGKIFKLLIQLIRIGQHKEKDSRNSIKISQFFQYSKVALFIFVNLPILIIKRYLKNYSLPNNAINKNYQSIISGEWYFK